MTPPSPLRKQSVKYHLKGSLSTQGSKTTKLMQFIKNGDKTKHRMRRTTLQDLCNHLLNVHLRTLLVTLSCKLQVVALDNFPPAYHQNVHYAFKTIWRKYQHSTSLALHTQSQRTSNKVLPNICNQACNPADVIRKSQNHVYIRKCHENSVAQISIKVHVTPKKRGLCKICSHLIATCTVARWSSEYAIHKITRARKCNNKDCAKCAIS